jgi:hypothetical protein
VLESLPYSVKSWRKKSNTDSSIQTPPPPLLLPRLLLKLETSEAQEQAQAPREMRAGAEDPSWHWRLISLLCDPLAAPLGSRYGSPPPCRAS